MGVSILLLSTREAYHAEVFILSSPWMLVCVMCSFLSVLFAIVSLSYVHFYVCVRRNLVGSWLIIRFQLLHNWLVLLATDLVL